MPANVIDEEEIARMRKRVDRTVFRENALNQRAAERAAKVEAEAKAEASRAAAEKIAEKARVADLKEVNVNQEGLRATREGKPRVIPDQVSNMAENTALKEKPGFTRAQDDRLIRNIVAEKKLKETVPGSGRTPEVQGRVLPNEPVESIIGGSNETITENDRIKAAKAAKAEKTAKAEKASSAPPPEPPVMKAASPPGPPPGAPPLEEPSPAQKQKTSGSRTGKVLGIAAAAPLATQALTGEPYTLFDKKTVDDTVDKYISPGNPLNADAKYLAQKANIFLGGPVTAVKTAADAGEQAAIALGAKKGSLAANTAKVLSGGAAVLPFVHPATAPVAWGSVGGIPTAASVVSDVMGGSVLPKEERTKAPSQDPPKETEPPPKETEPPPKEFAPEGQGIWSGDSSGTPRISVLGSPGMGLPEYEKLSNSDKIKFNVRRYDEGTAAIKEAINARRRLEGSPMLGETRGGAGTVLPEETSVRANPEMEGAFNKVQEDLRRGRISPRAAAVLVKGLETAFGSADAALGAVSERNRQNKAFAIEDAKLQQNNASKEALKLLNEKSSARTPKSEIKWIDGVPYKYNKDTNEMEEIPLKELEASTENL